MKVILRNHTKTKSESHSGVQSIVNTASSIILHRSNGTAETVDMTGKCVSLIIKENN